VKPFARMTDAERRLHFELMAACAELKLGQPAEDSSAHTFSAAKFNHPDYQGENAMTTPTWVGARLRDARDRCALAHDPTRGPFVAYHWVRADLAEQVHQGTTDYALAAWLEWGSKRGRSIVRARGLIDYLVPNLDGERTIETPAILLDADDGTTLALTGCTWGYGGEGPRGTALILTDAGFFPDDGRPALDFVVRLDGSAPWSRTRE
jgi:hypothetical protein